MANVVDIAIRGIDEATRVFEQVGSSATKSMEEAEKSVNNVDESIQDVSNLDVDTGGTEGAMQSASDSVENVEQSIQETQQRGQNFGDKMKGVFDTVASKWKEITVIAGTTGVAFEGFSRKQGDVNATLERTSIATGASTESLREMADGMSDSALSTSDAVEGMELLVQKGFDTEEQFNDILPSVVSLSDATGKDLPEAMEAADGVLRPFGDDLNDLGENTDQLSRIMAQTDVPIGSLERNLGRVPDELQGLKFGLDDAAAGVEVFKDRGFEGRESIREFRRAVEDSDGDMDAFLESIGLTNEEWEEYQKQVEPSKDLTDELAQANNDSMTTMEKMNTVVGNAMTKYGSFADLLGMLAPILISLGPILKGVTMATKAFNLVLAMNPVGLIITAIVALIAIIILLWKNWDEVSEFLATSWEWIKETAMDLFGGLGEYFSEFWEWLTELIVETWNAIIEFFQMIWEFIKEVFMTGLEAITEFLTESWELITETIMTVWNGIKEFFVIVWELIVLVVQTYIEMYKTVIVTVFNAIKEVITNIWNGIKTFFGVIWETIVALVTAYINQVKTNIETVFNIIKTVITTIWNAIKTVSSTVWNAIKTVVMGIINAFKGGVTSSFNAIKSVITSIWNAIRSVSTSVWNGIKGAVTGVVNGMKAVITSSFNSIKGAVTGVWNGIKSSTSSVWNSMVGIVTSPINLIIGAINGMINGINSIRIKSPKIPSWVPKFGGKSFDIGFNIPNIPSLATGGVVSNPTLAMVGDAGRGNPEIVAPQKMIASIIAEELKKVLGNVTGRGFPTNDQPQPLVLNVRIGRSEFKTFVEDITDEQDRNERKLDKYR